jgi:tRNA pseudouridine13 synthase
LIGRKVDALMDNLNDIDLPMVTADLPGIGGQIRTVPEDFEVEEIPAYEPAGTGEHVYLWIEKRGLSADWLVNRLAQALGIDNA